MDKAIATEIRDLLYGGSWTAMLADLRAAVAGKATTFRLAGDAAANVALVEALMAERKAA